MDSRKLISISYKLSLMQCENLFIPAKFDSENLNGFLHLVVGKFLTLGCQDILQCIDESIYIQNHSTGNVGRIKPSTAVAPTHAS